MQPLSTGFAPLTVEYPRRSCGGCPSCGLLQGYLYWQKLLAIRQLLKAYETCMANLGQLVTLNGNPVQITGICCLREPAGAFPGQPAAVCQKFQRLNLVK